jgi:hypothetical protein
MDDRRSDAHALEHFYETGENDTPRIWAGDDHEIWVVVGGSREDDLFGPGTDLRLCRAILEDGVLVLGHAEPESDPLFSDPSRGDDGGGH